MRQNLFVPATICLLILSVAVPVAGSTGADGSVTIGQPITGLYARGDLITFSGTNTGSGTTYLFITGPGLKMNGAQLQSTHPGQSPVIDGDATTFQSARVGTDNRWSYTWDKQNDLKDGTYTVYAASTPRDLAHISSTHYSWVTFTMMKPANIGPGGPLTEPSVVTQEGKVTISGIAKGTPHPGVTIWIIGAPGSGMPGYIDQFIEQPDSDGFYSLGYTNTRLEEGKYHVIVQHPGLNGDPDIYLASNSTSDRMGDDEWIWNRLIHQENDPEGTKLFKVSGPGSLQGDDAYEALIQAFRDPGVDDIIAITPLPTVASTGSGIIIPVVNSRDEEALAQSRTGFSGAGPSAGPSFEVDTVMVDPAGDLISGTPVTVSFRVNISGTGNDETFPSADGLQMSTGLEKPRWDYTLVLDGVENPQPGSNGRILMVSGWLLSYPSSASEYLKVTLSGTTPRVPSPENVTLFTATEYDSHNNRVPGSEISRTARNNPGTGQPVSSGTGVQANPAVPVTSGGTVIEKIRAGFSNANGAPADIFPTYRYHENTVDECSLVPFKDPGRPLADGFTYENATVFNIGTAGNYSSPFGKEETRIPIEQAKEHIKKAFPDISADRIDIEFDEGYSFRKWEFDMHKDDKQLVQGGLDSKTGEIKYYFIPSFFLKETQEKSSPATTIESARLAAENEIRERNGEIYVKLMDSQVDPDGNYGFNYRRIIRGVPSLNDGIQIGFDAQTGKVGSYSKSWEVPENAVATSSVPAISREQAIALVEREAKACYPGSAYSFRIVSADLQWMDSYPMDKFIPKPGVIPLSWHVRFDDKTIRGHQFSQKEDAWVDAQNGTLLSMEYFHNR
jgi:hypothetical protein